MEKKNFKKYQAGFFISNFNVDIKLPEVYYKKNNILTRILVHYLFQSSLNLLAIYMEVLNEQTCLIQVCP